MTKSGASWLPNALYCRLGRWVASVRTGTVVLTLTCDEGRITGYELREAGQVRYLPNGIGVLEGEREGE